MKLARDTWLIFQRQMTLTLRSPSWIFFGLAQPITYLLLFTPFLKPALASMGATSYADAYRIYVPGLLVVTCLYGGLFTGFGLLADLRGGIIQRCRVTPISRTALVLGRVLRDVAILLVQAVIITLFALPFGLRLSLVEMVLAAVLLVLIALMTTAISYDVTLLVRNEGALGPMINTVGQRSRCSPACCCRWHSRRTGCSSSRTGTRSRGRPPACGRCSTETSATRPCGWGC